MHFKDAIAASIFTAHMTIFSLRNAQNIIVIRTLPGLAAAAASAIDSMDMNKIVGTLAGDDTVMVVMRDNNAAAAFCGEIKNLTDR